MKLYKELSEFEQAVVYDIYERGPDCAKFISRRYSENLRDTMDILHKLEKDGWLERVKGTFLSKRVFKKPKHMNHTYYSLSRPAELTLRKFK